MTKSYAKSEFYYDRNELENEFRVFEINTNSSLIKPNLLFLQIDSVDFTLYDIEIEPFCTGLCCGPVGLTILTQKNMTVVEKKSFWLGCGTFSVSAVAGLVSLVIFDGGLFLF
ncbi:MAG: hypothetical protein ACKVQB_03605 [Bacteroidia bacterium]